MTAYHGPISTGTFTATNLTSSTSTWTNTSATITGTSYYNWNTNGYYSDNQYQTVSIPTINESKLDEYFKTITELSEVKQKLDKIKDISKLLQENQKEIKNINKFISEKNKEKLPSHLLNKYLDE